VSALVSGQAGKLIVLNAGSVWSVDTSGAEPAGWVVERVTDRLGCVAGATAVFTGQDLLFLSHLGVASLAGLATGDTVSAANMLSTEVQTLIDRVDFSRAKGLARAVTWGNFYLLAAPMDGEARADRILAYNTLTKKWSGEWSTASPEFASGLGGFGPLFTSRADDVVQTWVCDTDGALFTLEAGRGEDDVAGPGEGGAGAAAIESWVVTRALVFGAHEVWKQPFWCEAEFLDSTSTGMTLALVPDEEPGFPEVALGELARFRTGVTANAWPEFALTLPFFFTGRRAFRLPTHVRGLPRFRLARVLVHSAGGSMGLRQLRVAAFLDSVQLT
jgi:hypothetical protein